MHHKRGPQNREKKQMSSKGLWGIAREAFKKVTGVTGRSRKPKKETLEVTAGQQTQEDIESGHEAGASECACGSAEDAALNGSLGGETVKGRPRKIPIINHLMSACAMFAFKFPSLLQFDQRGRDESRDNLKRLFGIEKVPSDTHMREELDKYAGPRN